MHPIQPPDTFHLSAAVGWLELGNPGEARLELDRVALPLQTRPEVLEVRWQVEAAAQQWGKCREVAQNLLQNAPERPAGWIFHAYALRRAPGGGLQSASDALLPAAEKFPQEPIIPYNLACYACQMGNLAEAWKWLGQALAIGEPRQIKAMALNDPDLTPLWPKLAALE